ncbi:phosphoribosylanthranilate isomerase [Peribacillus asahii]|uniref:N-(5'-phosphoribosyl)anthranilate isomerase n=1 Tax=Peribacillus asahii TaxID=228899 RepID=A0A398BC50_9BACI|nr:phosphoribosylanthranilate isomerase [Peribacillus asahii]RID87645.1 phosphoribosylanthranilate isomerase [Peribacillus asahii]
MFVKICGVKTAEAAQIAADAGTDFIGFIFAESSRKIEPEEARAIAKELPQHIKKVGVFSNQSEADIIRTAALAGLDYIQLHGQESAELASRMPLPVIKAFSIESSADFTKLVNYPADYYLVDLPKNPKSAQRAKTLDWNALAAASLPFEKIILAGGLTADNVAEAIRVVKPFGVDVASGVETDGVKDEQKMRAFVLQAKQSATETRNEQ